MDICHNLWCFRHTKISRLFNIELNTWSSLKPRQPVLAVQKQLAKGQMLSGIISPNPTKFASLKVSKSLICDLTTGSSWVTVQQTELACRQRRAPLCLMSLPISRQAALSLSYWLLPMIAHQNNTTLLGTKIKAQVHICATLLSINGPLHSDTCDLKETVETVMNLSRQTRSYTLHCSTIMC